MVLLGVLGIVNGPVGAQQKTPAPSPAISRGPSGADVVNKALNPGPSDPDVPLPRSDLTTSVASQPSVPEGPQIYGRQEHGGGVLGLRVPIPADRKL